MKQQVLARTQHARRLAPLAPSHFDPNFTWSRSVRLFDTGAWHEGLWVHTSTGPGLVSRGTTRKSRDRGGWLSGSVILALSDLYHSFSFSRHTSTPWLSITTGMGESLNGRSSE